MLRSFRLGNYRSFRDEQELLLMPAYAKDRLALPVAAIYGANASGKSNLLCGLQFMAEAVRDSFASWSPDDGVPRRYFKLDSGSRDRPSVFVAELIEEGVRYTYGFEVDDERILSEWLYSYPERRKRILFDREADVVKFGSTIPDAHAKLEILEGLLRPNALFLSLAAQSNVGPLLPVYRWFTSRLVFRLDPGGGLDELGIGGFILENPALRDRLIDLIQAADFGISTVVVGEERSSVHEEFLFESDYPLDEEGPEEAEGRVQFNESEIGGGPQESPPDQLRSTNLMRSSSFRRKLASARRDLDRRHRRVRLVHGPGELFEFADESAGTRSWLGLLPTVLTLLRDGGTLVIDEIDASLHSLLSARLIALFNDPETNVAGGQLIFTTHDATLLHPPVADEVLDRDEVWFVEKDEKGASVLYPLTDFKPRTEDNLERRYLAGQYGAVPALYEDRFAAAVRRVDVEA